MCSSLEDREHIMMLLEIFGVNRVDKKFDFNLAPNIDYNPTNNDYQTITANSFLIDKAKSKKSNILIIKSKDII